MISIIISSYKPDILQNLKINISETIGNTPYEIIDIWNPGKMGICQAYNFGADKANYDYFLFIHEDVNFHTNNWGEKLIHHLQNSDTGVIGVAGSDYVPKAPSGWYINNNTHQFRHLIQNSSEGNQAQYENFISQTKHQVFALDGVFLAMRKDNFSKIGFSKELKGFHTYDLDLSLHSAKHFKNYVIGDILIEHFSLGIPNKEWFDGTIYIRKKYGSQYHTYFNREIELKTFQSFLYSYFQYYGISLRNMLKSFRFLTFKNFALKDYYLLAKIYYRYFKHRSYFEEKFKTQL